MIFWSSKEERRKQQSQYNITLFDVSKYGRYTWNTWNKIFNNKA